MNLRYCFFIIVFLFICKKTTLADNNSIFVKDTIGKKHFLDYSKNYYIKWSNYEQSLYKISDSLSLYFDANVYNSIKRVQQKIKKRLVRNIFIMFLVILTVVFFLLKISKQRYKQKIIYHKIYDEYLQIQDYNKDIQKVQAKFYKNYFKHNNVHGNNVVNKSFFVFIELKDYLEQNNLFLRKNLSLNKIAKYLNVNTIYLRQVIKDNTIEKNSFREYVNKMKIKYSIDEIQHNSKIDIKKLAYSCNMSYSKFKHIFISETGLNPKKFKKECVNLIMKKTFF